VVLNCPAELFQKWQKPFSIRGLPHKMKIQASLKSATLASVFLGWTARLRSVKVVANKKAMLENRVLENSLNRGGKKNGSCYL